MNRRKSAGIAGRKSDISRNNQPKGEPVKRKSILLAAVLSGTMLFLCTGTVSPSTENMRLVHSEVLVGDLWVPSSMTIVDDRYSEVRAEGKTELVSGRVSILTVSIGQSGLESQKASWKWADSAEEYTCAGTDISLFRKPGEKSMNRAEEFIAFINNDCGWHCVRVFQPLGRRDVTLRNFAQVVADVARLTAKR
jgi:hypothetical protein